MLKLISKVACVAAIALAASSTTVPAFADDGQPKKQSRCAFVRSIDHFQHVDDYTAIIETSPSRRFLVRFANSCRELKWAFFARIDSRAGMCLRAGDKIIVGRHGFRDRCFIKSIEPISRDQPMPVSN